MIFFSLRATEPNRTERGSFRSHRECPIVIRDSVDRLSQFRRRGVLRYPRLLAPQLRRCDVRGGHYEILDVVVVVVYGSDGAQQGRRLGRQQGRREGGERGVEDRRGGGEGGAEEGRRGCGEGSGREGGGQGGGEGGTQGKW